MGNDDNGEYLNNITISFKDKTKQINCNPKMTFEEIIKKFLQEYLDNQYDLEKLTLTINGVICYPDETLESYKNYISSNSIFKLHYSENIQNNDNDNDNNDNDNDNDNDDGRVDECYVFNDDTIIDYSLNFKMEINIEFFRTSNNYFLSNYNEDLFGLLKLCLLKEIAICDEFENVYGLPEHISNIITILKNGKIKYNEIK